MGGENYTAWEATLKGKGPHDTHTRRFRMSAPKVAADQTLPLLRGNHWVVDKRSALLASHTHSHGTNLIADKKMNLLPVELNSDRNNDGKIGKATDSSLKAAAQQSGASDEAEPKGTECVFVNDHFSNGMWDKETLDLSRPTSEIKMMTPKN